MSEVNDDWGPLSGLPGNPVMWVLIASELVVFGAIFIAFSIVRLSEPVVFAEAQNHLDRLAGAINTMVLLTSSLFAVLAVRFALDQQQAPTRVSLALASALGVVFLIVKSIEYGDKIAAGISTETNDFFMFYFLATGFHALHVVFGILLLTIVIWKNSLENVITVTAF